ncbi:MAG: BamA/TamA family outer membrane protein [Bacteroidetes bacterium]|nr:BamA/TamA family outer membrane protein [Bacteroidota bacterium]
MPEFNTTHVDAVLTNISRQYPLPQGMVGPTILPMVTVSKESGVFYRYNKGDQARIPFTKRQIRSESRRSTWGVDTDSYRCEEYALNDLIDEREYQQADTPLNLQRDTVENLQRLMRLDREKRIHDLVTDAAVITKNTTLTGTAQWTHRNFWGGARSFTASLNGQTGIGAVGSYPLVDYEARLSLRQPYVFYRKLSGTVGPFARYRDDVVEVATEYGVTAALLYEHGPLRTITLATTLSVRTVGSDSTTLVDPSTLLPGDAFRITRSQILLSAIYGSVDSPLHPRRGFVIRPSATAAGLFFTDASYAAVALTATGYVPLGENVGLVVRGSGGALLPAGSTDPAVEEDYLALRNELFFAGGTADVRGWPGNLLGPKFLDFTSVDTLVVFDEVDDDIAAYYNDRYRVRYRPVGAETKATASVQLNVPLPLGENWGASLFVDAGRVWRPAEGLYDLYANAAPDFPNLPALIARFRADGETIRYGAGVGIQYLTPIGFVTFAVAGKLNPSYFDLRSPRDILVAADIEAISGVPPDFDAVADDWVRRLQFHFTIGQRF